MQVLTYVVPLLQSQKFYLPFSTGETPPTPTAVIPAHQPTYTHITYKKFWEELIAYFPFTPVLVFDITQTTWKTLHVTVLLLLNVNCCHRNMFTEPLRRNGCLLLLQYFGFQAWSGTHIDKQGDPLSCLLFFQNKESRPTKYIRHTPLYNTSGNVRWNWKGNHF
jgi:hypothetical protein